MKRFVRVAIIFILVLVLLVFSFACKKTKTSEYASASLRMNDNGTFKILQLTDLHFINSTVTSTNVKYNYSLRDQWVKECVTTLINESNPDMIIVTGDSIYMNTIVSKTYTKSDDIMGAFKIFAQFMDSFDIPWAFTFGNHDEEGVFYDEETVCDDKGTLLKDLSIDDRTAYINSLDERSKNRIMLNLSKEEIKFALGDYLLSKDIKNCLYTHGSDTISGVGNYIINVVNADCTTNNSLVLMDSGSFIGKYQTKYACVQDDQLDWYEKAIKDISAKNGQPVQSLWFQHIPFPEYKTALADFQAALAQENVDWQDVIKADGTGSARTVTYNGEEITYHGGVYNEGEVCCSYIGTIDGVAYNGGNAFERILELGSTKYVFCGHDHRNTFSFTYKGICLSYGMSIDYSANGLVSEMIAANQHVYDETAQRGGTLITLNSDSSVDIERINYSRNLYREAKDGNN